MPGHSRNTKGRYFERIENYRGLADSIRDVASVLDVSTFWEIGSFPGLARAVKITSRQLRYYVDRSIIVSDALDEWETVRDAVLMQLPDKGPGHWQLLVKNYLGLGEKISVEPGVGWSDIVRTLSSVPLAAKPSEPAGDPDDLPFEK